MTQSPRLSIEQCTYKPRGRDDVEGGQASLDGEVRARADSAGPSRSKIASSTRSAQFSLGRHGCRRCSTAS